MLEFLNQKNSKIMFYKENIFCEKEKYDNNKIN